MVYPSTEIAVCPMVHGDFYNDDVFWRCQRHPGSAYSIFSPCLLFPERTVGLGQHELSKTINIIGATENAGPENAGPSKMQGWKTQDWKTQDHRITRDQLLWNAKAAKRQGIYCTMKNVQALAY